MVQMDDRLSIVENGYLAENDLGDLLEVYMGELVGDHVYDQYGNTFPLLFKIINTNDDLSIQVHPDNDVALEDRGCLGKTEMWYVVDAQPNTTLISGFNRDTNAVEVRAAVENGNLTDYLNVVNVKKGDVIFLPAGRVHALQKNITVAEIQQNSDVTYRLYDYIRPQIEGIPRPLHIEQSLRVLDYKHLQNPLSPYTPVKNGAVNLVESKVFITNLLSFDHPIGRDYAPLDSFVVYMCVEGEADVEAENTIVNLKKGDTVLIPASLDEVFLTPHGKTKLLETYIP